MADRCKVSEESFSASRNAEIKTTDYMPSPAASSRARGGEVILKAARIESEMAVDYFPDRETLQQQVNELIAQGRSKEVPSEVTKIGAGGELLPLADQNVVMMEERALPATPRMLESTLRRYGTIRLVCYGPCSQFDSM